MAFQMQAPKTNWTSVMENLDHEGFNVPDEKSFYLLMSIYTKACEVFINFKHFNVDLKANCPDSVFNQWK